MNYTDLVTKMEGWTKSYGLSEVKWAIAYHMSHSFCDYTNKDFCYVILEGSPAMGNTPKDWIEDSLCLGNEGKLYSEVGGEEEGETESLDSAIKEIEEVLAEGV